MKVKGMSRGTLLGCVAAGVSVGTGKLSALAETSPSMLVRDTRVARLWAEAEHRQGQLTPYATEIGIAATVCPVG
jgi:hypothetical protein